MYFDTHAHYDDEQFDSDREELLSGMESAGIELILNPGTDSRTSVIATDLANRYPFIYAAVGTHPHEAESMTEDDFDLYKKLAENPKVKAIGEIGLDYHYDLSPRDIQKKIFRRQMELARELALPVIIHEREACSDCLEIITQFKDVPGVYHCYSGSWETAKAILAQGWYLSFTGVITFKNARKSLEVIENMPLDRIMVETDSPYLAPVPKRGSRNSSLNIPYMVDVISEIRGLSHEEAAKLTLENGKRFLGID